MKKLLFIIFCLMGIFPYIKAQSLTGTVMDETNQPVAFANVVLLSLPDSVFIQGTITNEQGGFAFDQAGSNKKLLQISYIGYKPLNKQVTSGSQGILTLQSDAVMLGETVITGHRPTYTVKGSSLTTNVQNTLLSNIGTSMDVLKRIPGLRIDQEKKIEVFGKGAPLIYINGRQVRDNAELEQLNSKDMLKVELITNPGAEYDAEVKAVLKIKTLKPVGEGLGGYVRLAESKSQYWGHTQQVNMNYRRGGLDLFGSFQHQLFKQWQDESFQKDIYGDTHWALTDNAKLRMQDYAKALAAQLGINYQLNDKNSIGVNYQLMRMPYSGGQFDAFQSFDVLADGKEYDRMDAYFLMSLGNTMHQLNAYYNGRLTDKLGVDLNFDYVKGKSYQNQAVDEKSADKENRKVNSFSNANYDLYAGKLALSYPLGIGSVKLGGEILNTDRSSDYHTLEGIVKGADTRVKEQKFVGFLTYHTDLGKVSLDAGLRYEHTQFDYYEDNLKKEEQSRRYDNVFPNVSVSFPLKNTKNSLSYTMKTRRPGYSLLSSAVQYSNRFMYKQGNPLLQPQIMHDVTWMTGYKWLNISASYQYIKDYIWTESSLYNTEGSIVLEMNRNYNRYQRIDLNVMASPQFGIWQPSWGVYFTQQFFSTDTKDGRLSYDNPLILLKWDNDFRLPYGIVFSVSGEYQSAGSYADEQRYDYGMLNLGLRKSFLKDQLTMSLQGDDVLNTYRYKGKVVTMISRTNYETIYDSRKMMLSVTYRFNATRSKYKGAGAANDELRRL